MSVPEETWYEYVPGSKTVRALRHLRFPYEGLNGEKPDELAERYMCDVAYTYGFDPRSFVEGPLTPRAAGFYIRWMPPRSFEPGGRVTVTAFVRMARQFGWDERGNRVEVPGAGFRVVLRRHRSDGARYCVTSSSSTLHATRHLPDKPPSFQPFARQFLVDRLIESLGLISADQPTRQFQMRARVDHAHRLVPGLKIDVVAYTDTTKTDTASYRCIWDAEGEELRLRSVQLLGSNCIGAVFASDPVSRRGDPSITPDLGAYELDPLSEDVKLAGLLPVASGGQQSLIGDLIKLAGTAGTQNPLGIDPPQANGGAFQFSTRTDDFAAVNAYYHCDCAFRMAKDFGCTAGGYFQSTQFPVRVVHRGPIVISKPSPNPPTDRAPYTDDQVFTVNAQVLQDLTKDKKGHRFINRVQEIRFALASMADAKWNPLGAAVDRRIMWHEFGHALQVAGTGALELPFAHSVGDGLSAILSDPASALTGRQWNTHHYDMRGVTFPFVRDALRRHDRAVTRGWGWNGTLYDPGGYPDPLDPDGYIGEQILSSTLFRLYRALGGDAVMAGDRTAPDPWRRRRAAEYTAYLMIWAVGLLGLTDVSPSTPGILATALMETDALVGLFDYQSDPSLPIAPRQGGALAKVIRWAFEQQGLYWPDAVLRDWNQPGLPELVDVFIDDGRAGQYEFTDAWQALPEAIQVYPTGQSEGTGPVVGVPNDVFVTVGNRGTGLATGITARAWVSSTNPAAWTTPGLNATPDWTPLPINGGSVSPPSAVVASGGTTMIGPFEWQPDTGGQQALIVAVDAPGDGSLLSFPGDLACANGPTAVADLIPFDNNLGYRVWNRR